MTAGQRLGVGFALGGILTLLVHPTSRALMLYSMAPDHVGDVLRRNPLSRQKPQVFPPGDPGHMREDERFLTAYLIARKLNTEPRAFVRPGDYEIAREFVLGAGAHDPDNAYWPQLAAVLALRAGEGGEAPEPWEQAARKSRWEAGGDALVKGLWDEMASAEGLRLSWQGLLALRHRTDDPARLITRVGASFLVGPPRKDSQIERRLTTLFNAGLIRDGARSLQGGRLACDLGRAASFFGADPSHTGPVAAERVQASFVKHVRETYGEEDAKAALEEVQDTTAWLALLKTDEEIAAQRSRVTFGSVLCAVLPSALLIASLILGAIGLAGLVIARIAGPIPHPDSRWLYAAGIAGGLLIYWQTSAWMLGVWCLIMGVLLALPIEVARPKPIPWTSPNNAILVAISAAGLAFVAAWIAALGPSATLVRAIPEVREHMPAEPQVWAWVAFVSLSLTVPCAAVWAWLKKRPVLLTAGEALARVGATGALLGVLSAVALTPVCIYVDSVNRALVEKWIVNEPNAFRIGQP